MHFRILPLILDLPWCMQLWQNTAKESYGLASPITDSLRLPSYNIFFFSYNIFLNSLVMILDQKRFCLLKETSEKNCFLSSLERTLWSIVNNKCRNEVPGSLSLGSYFTTKEAIPSLIQLKGYSNSDKSFKMRLIFHYSGILPRCSHNSFFMCKIRAVVPLVGVIQTERTVMNLVTLAAAVNSAISALDGIESNVNSLSWVLMGNYTALDFLLANYGCVCAVANTASSIWIKEIDQIEQSILFHTLRHISYGLWDSFFCSRVDS